MGSEQGYAISRSLKGVLERSPDPVGKAVTTSWMPSKLLPLTEASFISSYAKCFADTFSFSYCNNPSRKV